MTGTKDTKQTYKITFKAELSEDDLSAMQSCFYQAMNEAMEIEEVWDLEIEEDE
jgi:DNA-binding protein YbaB